MPRCKAASRGSLIWLVPFKCDRQVFNDPASLFFEWAFLLETHFMFSLQDGYVKETQSILKTFHPARLANTKHPPQCLLVSRCLSAENMDPADPVLVHDTHAFECQTCSKSVMHCQRMKCGVFSFPSSPFWCTIRNPRVEIKDYESRESGGKTCHWITGVK